MKTIYGCILALVQFVSPCLSAPFPYTSINVEPKDIGPQWKRTISIDGEVKERWSYTKGENGPLIMVLILPMGSGGGAEKALEERMSAPGFRDHVKKVSDDPLTYEQSYRHHKKRYVVLEGHWLVVEQGGGPDTREEVVSAYTAAIRKAAKSELGTGK